MGGRTWWWIRHAPVTEDARLCINGRNDPECDLSNEETILACAGCLPEVATWIATGLSRTERTAAALQAAKDRLARTETVPALVEQDFGEWEGRRWSDLAGQEDLEFWNDPIGTAPPGGESYAEMTKRVAGAIADVGNQFPDGDLILVAHAGPIRAALVIAKPATLGESLALEVDPLSITRIREAGDADRWQVMGINEAPGVLVSA
ncbi:MAG: histidine phosphatase family protein [Rhodospirillales bacterium]|nr:histidine phosphatase family protein [Rhodospirillales bacterium]